MGSVGGYPLGCLPQARYCWYASAVLPTAPSRTVRGFRNGLGAILEMWAQPAQVLNLRYAASLPGRWVRKLREQHYSIQEQDKGEGRAGRFARVHGPSVLVQWGYVCCTVTGFVLAVPPWVGC